MANKVNQQQPVDEVTVEDMRNMLVNRWSSERISGLSRAGNLDQVMASTAKNMANLANKLMVEEGRNRLEAEHLAWQAFGM